MTLALPPLGWIVIISWTVLMIAAVATADAVRNPRTHANPQRPNTIAMETPGYQIIEASIDYGVRLRKPTAMPRAPMRNRRLQVAISA